MVLLTKISTNGYGVRGNFGILRSKAANYAPFKER